MAPSPLTILDDQMVLAGTVAGGAIQHDVLIHSSSDIADIANAPNPPATAAVATVNGDLTVKSDSRIVLDAAIVNVNVLNSPLDNTFTSGSDVVVDGAAQINNAGGTTTLRADDKLLLTSEADGNVVGTAGATVAVNAITSLQTLGRISGAATVNAATGTHKLETTAVMSAEGGFGDHPGRRTELPHEYHARGVRRGFVRNRDGQHRRRGDVGRGHQDRRPGRCRGGGVAGHRRRLRHGQRQ